MWNQRLPGRVLPRHTLRPPPHALVAPGHLGHCLSRAPVSMGSATRTTAAFSLTSSPPAVKGLLRKASFEMRTQVDREGQEPRHTCSNDRQVLALSAAGASLLVLWLPLRTGVQRTVCVGFPGGPPCRRQAQACLNCHTHAKLRMTFRSLVVRGSLVRLD